MANKEHTPRVEGLDSDSLFELEHTLAKHARGADSQIGAAAAESQFHLSNAASFRRLPLAALITMNGGAVLGFAVFVSQLPPGLAACFAQHLVASFAGFVGALVLAMVAAWENARRDVLEANLVRLAAISSASKRLQGVELSSGYQDSVRRVRVAFSSARARVELTSLLTTAGSLCAMVGAIVIAAQMFGAFLEPSGCPAFASWLAR